MSVTKRQREVLDFIQTFVANNKYSPTLEEVGRGVGLKSLSTVHKHVSNLEKNGYLQRDFNRSRSIDILEPPTTKPRFVFEGPHHLFDTVEQCYWVRERDCNKSGGEHGHGNAPQTVGQSG